MDQIIWNFINYTILDMCGHTDTKILDMCGQTDTKIIDIYVDKQEKN